MSNGKLIAEAGTGFFSLGETAVVCMPDNVLTHQIVALTNDVADVVLIVARVDNSRSERRGRNL